MQNKAINTVTFIKHTLKVNGNIIQCQINSQIKCLINLIELNDKRKTNKQVYLTFRDENILICLLSSLYINLLKYNRNINHYI